VPHPDPNPLDCYDHGSHVAGILAGSGVTADGHTYAGPYDGATDSQTFQVAPGVAPRADLYAVRVFGCVGSSEVVTDAIEWAVDNDMDVINMSLGGAFGAADDPDAVAASNAVKSGIVVVASAGNSGAGPYIAGSPANGDGVLSVAALDSIPSFPGARLGLGDATLDAENSNGAPFPDGIVYPVVVLGTPDEVGLGCDAADYQRPDVSGALVVTRRGDCDRVTRAVLGQQAGAAAVAMINVDTDPGYPPFEGEIPGVSIPFFGIRSSDAPLLSASASLTARPFTLPNPGYLAPAPFSSGGPRFGDSSLKPNVIAPGVSIVSTSMGTGTGGIAFSGTSMAAPNVAGLAALTRQAHPSWQAAEIAAAISNTADPSALVGYSTRLAGAGLPVARDALNTLAVATSAGAPAVSFGFVGLDAAASLEAEVAIDNLGDTPLTFDVSVPSTFAQGVEHAVSVPAQLSVAAHSAAALPLHVELAATAASDPLTFSDFAGIVELSPANPNTNQGVLLRVPYAGVVRPVSRVAAMLDGPAPGTSTGGITLSNSGAAHAGTAELYAWGIEGAEDGIGCNDVRAAGVQSAPSGEDRALVFAITGWQRCSNAAQNEYDITITTESGAQFLVIGADRGALETGDSSGELATLIVNLATEETVLLPALAPTDSSTVYLFALGSQLGLSADQPRFSYFTETFSGALTGDDPPSEAASFNAYAGALTGLGQAVSLEPDALASVSIGIDPAEWALTPPKGVLVILEANAPGTEQAALFSISPPGTTLPE
jgi:minor extracellular serine protease Vpr